MVVESVLTTRENQEGDGRLGSEERGCWGVSAYTYAPGLAKLVG